MEWIALYLLVGIILVVFMEWSDGKGLKWDEVALMAFAWPLVFISLAIDWYRGKL